MGINIWQHWGQFKWTILIWCLCSFTPFSLYLNAWKKNKTPQFKKWEMQNGIFHGSKRCCWSFWVSPTGTFTARTSLWWDNPSKEKGAEEGTSRWHWVGVTNWLRCCQQPLADLQLPLRLSQDWGNVTVTECAASVCPTKQGKKCMKKNPLRSNRKGNFKAEQFRHCWPPGVFDPWPRVKSSALLQGPHWDVSHLLPTHRNQACGIYSWRLILALHKCDLILAWDPNANPLGKPCSPGHFPAIWVIPG